MPRDLEAIDRLDLKGKGKKKKYFKVNIYLAIGWALPPQPSRAYLRLLRREWLGAHSNVIHGGGGWDGAADLV